MCSPTFCSTTGAFQAPQPREDTSRRTAPRLSRSNILRAGGNFPSGRRCSSVTRQQFVCACACVQMRRGADHPTVGQRGNASLLMDRGCCSSPEAQTLLKMSVEQNLPMTSRLQTLPGEISSFINSFIHACIHTLINKSFF